MDDVFCDFEKKIAHTAQAASGLIPTDFRPLDSRLKPN